MRTPIALTLFFIASTAGAQRAAPVAVRASDNPSVAAAEAGAYASRPQARFLPYRIGLGVIGAGAGMFAGALIGANTPHHPCRCDDPGLSEALTGAAIGTIVGSGIFAGGPRLGSECSTGARIALGMLGGLGGGVLGGVASAQVAPQVAIGGIAVGAGIGAALASAAC